MQIGYFLHWSIDTVLDLEHPARNRVLTEINKIHAILSGVDGVNKGMQE